MRWIEWVSRRAMGLAGWCYLAMTVLICFDIGARRLLGFSTEATTELSGYLMAIGMSWALAGTLLERGHVRIDVLLQKLPLGWRVVFHLLSLSALLLSIGFFIWGSASLALDSLSFGSTDLTTLMARSLRQSLNGEWQAMDHSLMSRSDLEEADETLQALGADAPALATKDHAR
jgi:TRAP-type C4-dicarboxylate transport system permease small subunit